VSATSLSLGVGPYGIEIEVLDDLHRTVAALKTLHDVHLVVGEQVHDVACQGFGVSGHVSVAREDVAAELYPVTLALPPTRFRAVPRFGCGRGSPERGPRSCRLDGGRDP
jgi:hypothetical protein